MARWRVDSAGCGQTETMAGDNYRVSGDPGTTGHCDTPPPHNGPPVNTLDIAGRPPGQHAFNSKNADWVHLMLI